MKSRAYAVKHEKHYECGGCSGLFAESIFLEHDAGCAGQRGLNAGALDAAVELARRVRTVASDEECEESTGDAVLWTDLERLANAILGGQP